ncbi:MAG TPA: glycerophosphodiester phosphodiesterase family protein, partial [Candidatus Binataceae bacterium]|nr:glycerophosphodiester phosphodiesterase family protein [Candidatus Binataceae bacterium]
MPKILNIAHRGDSRAYPENTLAAFSAAAELGVDMCELDVQLTGDGALAVIHDETVDRTTNGRGEVARMTLKSLQELDPSAKFAPRCNTGERIPSLEQVFAATRGRCA